MFGLEILDVVIGLMFVYLLLALLATAINEYISAVLNLRGKELAKGLGRLLDDLDDADALQNAFDGVGRKVTTATASLTEQFYNHRLIRPLTTRRGWFFRLISKEPRLPSYIPARTFALALMDVLGIHNQEANLATAFTVPAGQTMAQAVAAAIKEADAAETTARAAGATQQQKGDAASARLKAQKAQLAQVLANLKLESSLDVTEHLSQLANLPGAANLPPDLQSRVATTLAGAETQLQKLHDSVEVWFNNSMDRVSGAYKRTVQGALLVIGLFIASCSDADTIDMWRRLSENDELRTAMVKRAEATVAALDTAGDGSAAARTDTTPAPAPSRPPANAAQPTDSPLVTLPATNPQNPAPAARPDSAAADSAARAAAVERARNNYLAARARLDSMELKLGWTTDEAQRVGFIKERRSGEPGWRYNPLPVRRPAFWYKIIGLLLTAIAISLGAPFWFDMLNKVISIRATGRSPAERPKSPEGEDKRAAGQTPR